MKRFFAEQTEENFVLFSKEESGHIVRVIRMREGDELIAADGKFDALTLCRTGGAVVC